MRKFNKTTVFLLVILTMVFSVSVYAVVKDTTAYVTNRISTDDVHIELSEYEVQESGEVSYVNRKTVVPGETVSKIPRIKNLAAECWVRVQVNFAGEASFSEVMLEDISDAWKKIGSYYYYTKPLEKKESVDLFRRITIPTTVTEADSDKEFQIEVIADAIQKYGVEPDFESEDPWNGVEIEDCIHTSEDIVYSEADTVQFSVEYKDGSKGLIAEPDDFFQNFEKLLPGMTVSDRVTIRNSNSDEVEVFFRTEYDSGDEEAAALLEAVQLKVARNDQILYQGNLKSEKLKERISLGTYSRGDSGELSYTLEVPAELQNAYARRAAEVRWIFEAAAKETVSEAEEHGTGSSGSSPVKTGDPTSLVLWYVLCIASFSAWLFVLKKRRGSSR